MEDNFGHDVFPLQMYCDDLAVIDSTKWKEAPATMTKHFATKLHFTEPVNEEEVNLID